MNISKIIVNLVASAFITSAFALPGSPDVKSRSVTKVVKGQVLQGTEEYRQAARGERQTNRQDKRTQNQANRAIAKSDTAAED